MPKGMRSTPTRSGPGSRPPSSGGSADDLPPLALRRHYDQMVERVSVDPELRPHIAVTPGPPWVWNDFCTSFAALGAAPSR